MADQRPSQSDRQIADREVVRDAKAIVAAMPEWKRVVYTQEVAYFQGIAEVARRGR